MKIFVAQIFFLEILGTKIIVRNKNFHVPNTVETYKSLQKKVSKNRKDLKLFSLNREVGDFFWKIMAKITKNRNDLKFCNDLYVSTVLGT